MSVHDREESRAVAPQSASASDLAQPQTQRDWGRLTAAHARIAILCPVTAATLFALLSPDRASLLHLGGLFAFVVTIGCTYLFFGVFAFFGVLIASPILALISKIPGPAFGLAVAFVLAGGLAWWICGFWVNDVPAFQMSATGTAALASAALENAWRRSRPPHR